MTENKSITDYLKILFNGILMGTANKIPGISGGLVAIAIGFYEELIFSLKRFDKTALKFLLKAEFKDFFKHINGKFLFLILSGIVISYFSTSKILEVLLNNFEIYVWSLFFGLVIGTIFHLRSIIELKNFKNICFILIGTSIGIFLSLADPAQENDNLYFVFICGIISVSGMILPGLSGSYLLLLMGSYTLIMVDSVNALYFTLTDIFSFNFDFVYDPERIYLLKVILFFTIGSVCGLIFLSNILSTLLKRFKSITISIIVGFIAGSLRGVWPWKTEESLNGKVSLFFPDFSLGETWLTLFYIIIGILFVVLLERFANKH